MYPYKKIKLKDGTTRDEHRLVMERHLGRKLSRAETVHHRDGNKMNNELSNLEVIDAREHGRIHGKDARRCKRGIKLTEAQVIEIKRLIHTRKARELAEMYGVHRVTITEIKSGRTWGDVIVSNQ